MLLHRGLTQAANLPAADRGLRIALELEDAPFAHAPHDAAGRSALRAGRCVKDADARDDEIFRLDIGLDELAPDSIEVWPQPASAIVVPPRPTACKKSRRLTPLPLIEFPL
jgi:hypothetical protein